MRRLAGRALMALGLVLLPVGLWHGVVRDEGMTTELALLAAGALAFLVGRALQDGRP
ncbi:MAG: hypothetical protein L6R43_18180 [Planctomycetes bacterium]|nr:hypothetical protein [Planctomycetota bacterium]